MRMRATNILVITVMVIAVAAVFLAPSTSLEPTALRAHQAAKMLMVALLAAALSPSFALPISPLARSQERTEGPLAGVDDLVALNCTRLC